MDSSSTGLLPNLSPRRSSVSAAVMGMMSLATPSRPPTPPQEESPSSPNDRSAVEQLSAAQYVSRGSYLVLKQQLVDERVTYLREVMALRQQVIEMEGSMKRYYEMAVERHAQTYNLIQGNTKGAGLGGSSKVGGSGTLSPSTIASPGYGRRSSLYGMDAPSGTSMPVIPPRDESLGPAVYDLNTSNLLSDGRNPQQLTSPARSQSPRPTHNINNPPSQQHGGRPIVYLYPPEPPAYTPVSLQLVPAERLAAALSSAAVLEEQQELHKRALLQLEATHKGELHSQQQKYDLLVADHERQGRDRKQKAELMEAQTATYRTRCRVDAFKAVEKRLHDAEADREQLAEHVRVLQSKLADVQSQLVAEKEIASETSNQLAAVRQQQGLVLHERSELRSALVAIQKDRNRLEHIGAQRSMSGSAWGKLAESTRRDEGSRTVQFTGGGGVSLMSAVTGALQRSKEKQPHQGSTSPTQTAAGSISPRHPKAPRIPRRPTTQEDALLGVRTRHSTTTGR